VIWRGHIRQAPDEGVICCKNCMEGLKHEEETEDRVISPQFSSKSVEKCHKCVLWSGRHHALFWARFINNTIHKILLILGLLPQALGFV
jgi:hypothetical protein